VGLVKLLLKENIKFGQALMLLVGELGALKLVGPVKCNTMNYTKPSPLFKKQKGGGTTKACLPLAKIRSMSKSEKDKVIRAKKSAGKAGKYKRDSKTNVKGARKSGATLRDWFKKEDWRQVANPSKKCGEK